MTTIQASVDVERPVDTVYNQWTQFESFPEFMTGVERVEQQTDTRAHWYTSIGGVKRDFHTWRGDVSAPGQHDPGRKDSAQGDTQ